MKIVFISHCNVEDNSAVHILNIAAELTRRKHDCVMVVPEHSALSVDVDAAFPIISYRDVMGGELPDAIRGVDLIHAWTPREHVRKITLRLQRSTSARVIVHMEDNEEQIIANHIPSLTFSELCGIPDPAIETLVPPNLSHPRYHREFIEEASGYTCLIDRLLEFAPSGIPAVVFWPGFEPPFLDVEAADEATRRRYGVKRDEIVILFSGNVHKSVVDDIRNLYLAVALLRARGYPAILMKTGRHDQRIDLPVREVDEFLIDFGFIPRSEIPALLSVADILVQPGASGEFNDYRFPGKLPGYLASGRPVILPETNIGHMLEDGRDVLKLSTGSVEEIADKIERLIRDPGLARALGQNARTFAAEQLTWQRVVDILEAFYRHVIARHSRRVPFGRGATSDRDQPDSLTRARAAGRLGKRANRWIDRHLVKLIAFYSPRFSSIGESPWSDPLAATDWIDVFRGRPIFSRHRQPQFPGELGLYDQALVETFRRHVEYARAHEIHGFCFDYHWVDGRHLFQRLIDVWIRGKRSDFPFCVCWTNDTWEERGHDGNRIAVPQVYSSENDQRIITDLIPLLRHRRYIGIDGAPLLLVSNVASLPAPSETATRWREICRQHGLPRIVLASVQPLAAGDPRRLGFDVAVDVPPAGHGAPISASAAGTLQAPSSALLEDYLSAAMSSMHEPPVDYVRFRGVMTGWDDTPRRGETGRVFINGSAKAYQAWLRYLVQEAVLQRHQQEPLIFINAWNRWTEGAYLEPDQLRGRVRLEATWNALWEGIRDHHLAELQASEKQAATEFSVGSTA